MAARLLARSKTLNLSHLLPLSFPIYAIPYSSQLLRSLHSFVSPPPLGPLDHGRVPPTPDPRSAAVAGSTLSTDPSHNVLLGSTKIWGNKQISQIQPVKSMIAGTQALPRSFSEIAHGGAVMCQSRNTISQLCSSAEKNILCNGKEGNKSEVISFSPLERSQRKSGLGNESSKIKLMDLSQKITYASIPALVLISKSSVTTSLLIFSVYWQIYGFFKEIFLDYVHQEVTRKWILIYFKLLLLILAKDTILDFDLV